MFAYLFGKRLGLAFVLPAFALIWLSAPSVVSGQAEPDAGPEKKAASAYTVKALSDRPDAIYKVGEEATFTIAVSKDGKPLTGQKFRWRLSNDGFEPPLKSGEGETKDGTFSLKGTLDHPGFLQCRVDLIAADERVSAAYGGAGFDPLTIQPSLPPPRDFDAFWAEQRKQVDAFPPNIRLTPVNTPEKDLEAFDLQADCAGGLHLSAYYVRPRNAKVKSLPAILLTHGAGVGSSQLRWAAKWAKEGFIALDFNVHGLPNGQPVQWYADKYHGELKEYFWQGRESRDDMFFRTMLVRLMTAANVLLSQPEWDGKTCVVYGRSQGGGQAIAAAGLDPRVSFIAAQIPALCDHTGFVVGRSSGWPKLVVIDKDGKPEPKSFEAARYFDTMNFVRRTKAGAFFSVGFIDVKCPPSGVYASYNLVQGSKSILTLPTMGHQQSVEGDTASREAILKFVHAQAAVP